MSKCVSSSAVCQGEFVCGKINKALLTKTQKSGLAGILRWICWCTVGWQHVWTLLFNRLTHAQTRPYSNTLLFESNFSTRSETSEKKCGEMRNIFWWHCTITQNVLTISLSTHRFISFEPSKLCVCLNIFCALLSILFIKFEFDSAAASVSARATGSASDLMSLRVAKKGTKVLQTHRRYASCKNNKKLMNWNHHQLIKINYVLAVEPEGNKLNGTPPTPVHYFAVRISKPAICTEGINSQEYILRIFLLSNGN